MCSTYNEGKSVIAKRLVYIDNIINIVNKCNNLYRSTIKMKPVDIKRDTYID